MSAEQHFLDVNIVMYAAGKPSEHKEPCTKVLQKMKAGKLRVAIDTEIIQELLYRYHRIGLHEEAVKLAWYLLKLRPNVLPISQKDVERSIHLYNKYWAKRIPPRDTIHLATMLSNGIEKIISVDKHFGEVITEVQRIDPREVT